MTWLNKYKRIWRAAILLLLFVALMGPWAFDLINVPAEFPCSPPFIRLEGDFCGHPLSGMKVFLWMIGGFIGMVGGFVTGSTTFTVSVGEILGAFLYLVLIILLFLPFVTTLRRMRSGDLRRNRMINIVVWGLAALFSGFLLVEPGFSRQHRALWGLWLYVGLAISALVVEVLLLTARRRAARDHEDSNTVEGR